MIEWLLRKSLRQRTLVLGAAVILLLLGSYRSAAIPVDVFPDLTAPRVTVVTESTGMAAEEVEQLISFPIETAVSGTAGLRRVRSASAPGISIVWAEFDWSTPQNVARQRVTERLQGIAGTLPPEASASLLAPASSVMGEIAFVGLTSETLDPIDLRRRAEVDVRRRLLAVEGVSQVVAIGGQLKQYQVIVDPDRVIRFGLTLADVAEALRRGSLNTPGGYMADGGQESVIRVLGRSEGIADIADVLVARRDGISVRVADVADVKVGAGVVRGMASYAGRPAVILSITKQPEADTMSTTARVDAVLAELQEPLAQSGIELRRDIFRQQDFIDTSLENLVEVLRDGALLVVLVLLVFLWSLRPTIISLVAIPLSLVTAALALDLLGLTIDAMTLGGLAIAIGELVDDAIVDVENVMRRLRERAHLPGAERASVLDTVLQGSLEIRPAIVSATLVIMVVFMPLLLLEGLEGRLLRPLAIAYLVAIFASLLVAVTVTPVLCSLLLPKVASRQVQADPPLVRWLLRGYGPVLRACIARPVAAITLASALGAASVVGLLGTGRAFLPEFNEGSLTINMVLLPGTSLEQSDALATVAELALMADPGVLSVGRRTGRAERDEHVLGVETSEFEVRLSADDARTKGRLLADIRERLKVVPGAHFSLGQPLSHRIEHMLSGQRSALSIKVVGDDLATLRDVAGRVEAMARAVKGLVDVQVEQVVEIPQLVVRIDERGAADYGFSSGEAARAISLALWGEVPTRIYEEGTSTDVVVRYDATALASLEALRELRVPTPSGTLAPIEALADLRRDSGPNYILRENVRRRVVVTANVAGSDMAGGVQRLREVLAEKLRLPPGVHLEYAGKFERERATRSRLLWLGLLAIIGVALIVQTTLQSVRRTTIVLTNLPLAMAGGVVGVYLAGGVLSVATTIGFITLFGIATRNGILLATRTRELEAEGLARMEAVTRSARERLSPILMTALTAALGLLPLGLSLGKPGSEIQAPMALVILCGVLSSTALNMLVVPALLARWGGQDREAVSGGDGGTGQRPREGATDVGEGSVSTIPKQGEHEG